MRKMISMVMSAVLLSGCAPSMRVQNPALAKRPVRSVTVVPAASVPQNNFRTYAKGAGAGAGKGALSGAGSGAAHLSLETIGTLAKIAGPFGAIVGIYLLPYTLAAGALYGGMTGAAKGANKAAPAEDVQKVETTLQSAVASLDVQNLLAAKLVETGASLTDVRFVRVAAQEPAASDQSSSSPGRIEGEMVLEIAVKELGFQGGEGASGAIAFFMIAEFKAYERSDEKKVYTGRATHASPRRTWSEWERENAAALERELGLAYADISRKVVKRIFMTRELAPDEAWSPDKFCVLRPFAPETTMAINPFSKKPIFPEAGSLQPTFEWEIFPRDRDREFDNTGMLARVSDVTYDLRIWESVSGRPGRLVYEKQGLSDAEQVRVQEQRPIQRQQNMLGQWEEVLAPEPVLEAEQFAEYTIESRLNPSTDYYWTVRARYRLDDETIVTGWAQHRMPYIFGDKDPCVGGIRAYYRFRTPGL